ncbi:MAG: RluA family pseudouridine synthase [Phycisphaerae bacterium]
MREYSVEPNPTVPFEVAHADAHLLVVAKPPGVVTQPGKKHERTSLLNGLFCRYGKPLQNLGAARGWGLLHRLDKDTSGLVLVALRVRAYEHLLDQFKRRLVKKTYWAIVAGTPRPAQGVIQKPIAEIVGTRKRAVIRRDGKQAITAYRILQCGAGATLIEARPKTGRLHQIRVHMASLGHPVVGDALYATGSDLPPVPRHCLHAASLSFVHPEAGRRLTIVSPWPADLRKTLKRLGLTAPTAEQTAR